MKGSFKNGVITMVLGDIAIFAISLYFALLVRQVAIPEQGLYLDHLLPFLPIFALWFIVFFACGLYERRVVFFRDKLKSSLVVAQSINFVLAGVFFYTISWFGISPKTILFLVVVFAAILTFFWRRVMFPKLSQIGQTKVFFIGGGNLLVDIERHLSKTLSSDIKIVGSIDDGATSGHISIEEVKQKIRNNNVDFVVVDTRYGENKSYLDRFYDLVFDGVRFIDIKDFYEEILEKAPLSLIDAQWFVEHVSVKRGTVYDFLKRIMDLVISIPLGIISLVFYPFTILAIKLDDGGPVYLYQDRVGERGKNIRIIKFRSMKTSDAGKWVTKDDDRITKVGKFLRKSRIDELPQLWNVIKGDLSLIGPRPELPRLVDLYIDTIPHYGVRHAIRPGLSGWAQIHHDIPPHSIDETKEKLAYDLYYIKRRSFVLDLKIALQTIKTLISRTGI